MPRFFLFSLFALTTTAVLAQSQPDSVPVLEKVVVQEPALTADAIEATAVRLEATAPVAGQSLESFANQVANLHVSAGGAGSFGNLVTMRGLTNTPYFSDPSVTFVLGDLPLGNAFTYPTDLFGFSSAVVWRGPQGVKFGRGGEAGVVVLQLPEPAGNATGELKLAAGDHGLWATGFAASSARSEKIDLTILGSALRRDGYVHNTTLGATVDDQSHQSLTARLRVRPTPTSEFTLQFVGNRARDGAQPLVPLGGPLYSVSRAREGSTNTDFTGAVFKAAFEIPLGLITSTTSRTEWKLSPYENRLVLPPTLDSRVVQSQKTWNEELRLASASASELKWHVAGWWSSGTTEGAINREIPGLFPIEASTFSLDSKTAAIFGEVTNRPDVGWGFTAGLRLEETKRSFDRRQTVPGPGVFTADRTFGAALPKVAVSYSFSNATTASVSVALATKPGGWSAYTGNASLAGFSAEKATAYEAGIESVLLQKSLTVAARVFDYEIRDYQIERSFTATDYLVVNAPRARSIGGEVELAWRLAPEWTVNGALGITDVTLQQFTDPYSGISYSGNRAPYAPAYQANLQVAYRAKSGLFATAGVVGIGRTNYDESEDPMFSVPAHAIVHARIGYETRRWSVSLYGENLGNRGYYSLIIPGVGHGAPGAPRTAGAEVSVRW